MKIKPNSLPSLSSLLGLVLTLLVLVLAVLISGCGPGVGGSGTGLSATLDDFGATAAPVCESDLAAQLRCPAPGTQVTWFADSSARTSLRIEGNRAQLDATCAQIQFSGEWGKVGSQGGRFFGNATTPTGTLPAVLVATPTGSGMLVQLQTAQGASLLGPLLLVSVPAQPAPAVCG